jgi:ribosomal protein L12E/L44/L45/RPP1/RPP2
MNDHIPDPTKMINDTPRTDEAQFGAGRVSVSFACQLERELNAANVEIEEKRKDVVWLATEKAKLEERIKRLEEALGCVVVSCNHLHHRKKHQHKLGEPCPVEGLIRKAKEAKP